MAEAGPGNKKQSGPQMPALLSWVAPALKNKRTIKTWIRCCVALTVTLVLMVDGVVLNSMGQAGFFAAIVCIMLPPSLALSLFVFAAFTLLLGMLLGWAWGSAAMAAALSVRNQALLARQQQEVQSMLRQGIPASIQLQSFVFHGLFLDPRSSAVYGAFFFIGTFALGALRAHLPRLTLLSVFGSIVLDILCSYGPLFPNAQYTIPRLFLIPTAYYVAVAVAATILLFPESLNHVWLNVLTKSYFQPILDLLLLQSRALDSRPSDHEYWATLNAEGNRYRRQLVTGTELLLGQIGFVDLEISVGFLGPGDLKNISKDLKSLGFRTAALHAFHTAVYNVNASDVMEEKAADERLGKSRDPKEASRYMALRRQIREREIRHGHDLDSLVPILRDSSAELRRACENGIQGIQRWFEGCNHGRWPAFFRKLDTKRAEERHAHLVKVAADLRTALEEFRKSGRAHVLKPYERFFDPQTGKLLESITKNPQSPDMFAARSLYICFVFVDAINAFAEQVERLLQFVVELDSKRQKPRVWFPSGFGKLGRKLRGSAPVIDTPAPISMGSSTDLTTFTTQSSDTSPDSSSSLNEADSDIEEDVEQPRPSPRRNPDALPPRTALGRFFIFLGSVLRWFKSPHGIFALRHAILSVAFWVPSVCRNSAWFYYDNKGIWALIMAQTSLAMFTGDQIAGFFIRIAGTICGLLIGMATWYIGSGHGLGNPYGVVIATVILTMPWLLGRIAAPPEQMMLWTMSGVTVVFVVGYSWINSHIDVLSNSGVGVVLAWKRALLVIIGFTGSFIVMMFPHPTSGRTLVRRTLSTTMSEIGHILSHEIEAFLAEEAKARDGRYEKVEFVTADRGDLKPPPKQRRVQNISKRVLDAAARLQALEPSLKTAKFEPQLQGIWPQEKYVALHQLHTRLLSSLVLLTTAFTELDTRWCSVLVHKTPFLNPNFLSDLFSKIAIVSNALSSSQPLPPALPVLRDRVIYHERRMRGRACFGPLPHGQRIPSSNSGIDESDGETTDDFSLHGGQLDGSSVGFEELTLDVLMDDQLPAHATAVVALSNTIRLIDEISDVVRDLCGEMSFEGYSALQRDYIFEEEKLLGAGNHEKLK